MILSKEIIREWNLENLSSERQKEMVERIGRILYQAILVKSLDILSPEEQDELDLLLENNNTTPEDTIKYLQAKIPTFDLMVIEERRALKEDMLVPAL